MKPVRFTNRGLTLAGTLTMPDVAGPCPGVVMIGGSGPSDRDNAGYFPPIRDHLVAAGIAVLSYDKRGVGESSGDWRTGDLTNLASDTRAALAVLREQPGVDTAGLFGHSEGGWVALNAAAGRDDVPWVVTNSCPGTTPAVQDRHALAVASADDAALARYDRLVAAARRDADFAEAKRLIGSADIPWDFTHLTELDWEFQKRKQDHDPIPDVRRLHCPHLAIFGSADPLVPVADSIRLFTNAARQPNRTARATLTIEVFPGANHRIQTNAGLAPTYLTTLTRWITSQ
jgi:hypothetical protein